VKTDYNAVNNHPFNLSPRRAWNQFVEGNLEIRSKSQ